MEAHGSTNWLMDFLAGAVGGKPLSIPILLTAKRLLAVCNALVKHSLL